MPTFYPYHPEQAYLLPPSVRDVLSDNHLCFFVSRSVEQLDLSGFVSKLRASDGSTVGTCNAGTLPFGMAFDGANIWVANINGITFLNSSHRTAIKEAGGQRSGKPAAVNAGLAGRSFSSDPTGRKSRGFSP